MAKTRLKHVNTFNSKGREYHYFRRGQVSVRLPGIPGSAEFMEAYARLLHEQESAETTNRKAHQRGTVDWLIAEYESLPKYGMLAPTTKEYYARMFEVLRQIGSANANDVKRAHIQALRRRLIPRGLRTCDQLGQVASALFGWAKREGYVTHNPAEDLDKWNVTEEYRRWTSQELKTFVASDPPPSMMTAYMLALHSGQRRGDIIALTWSDYDKVAGTITLRQGKTGKKLTIRTTAELRRYLESLDRQDSTVIVPTKKGNRYDKSRFSTHFRVALKSAGLEKDVTLHGLNKTCMARLAEHGCTVSEMMGQTGRSQEMCAYYHREAEQERLSTAAVVKLETRSKS